MADLGPRGTEFHDGLVARVKRHEVATKALIREAARLVDRLEDLDDIIAGKDVLNLLRFRLRDGDGSVAEVKFDGVMSEARQQQAALSGLMKVILPNLEEQAATQDRSGADEIAERRAARGTGSARSPRSARSS